MTCPQRLADSSIQVVKEVALRANMRATVAEANRLATAVEANRLATAVEANRLATVAEANMLAEQLQCFKAANETQRYRVVLADQDPYRKVQLAVLLPSLAQQRPHPCLVKEQDHLPSSLLLLQVERKDCLALVRYLA